LKAGAEVNLERPLTLGGRLGGHLVQGHIDDTGKITAIKHEQEAIEITVEVPAVYCVYGGSKVLSPWTDLV